MNLPMECFYCERKLEKPPTDLGWVAARPGVGICFDCIERLNAAMNSVKKAEEEEND